MMNNGSRAFTAGEALLEKRRVKIKSGTTTTPPEVEYADAGEQHIGITAADAAIATIVTINLRTLPGSAEGVASEALSKGATLYGAADGKIADTSSGSAIGVALEAATADGDVIEWVQFAVLSTTAATVSIADTGAFTAQTDVEAAVAELYQHLFTTQAFLPIPLFGLRRMSSGALPSYVQEIDVPLASLREVTTNDIPSGGGILATDTTPALEFANADTDSQIRLLWAASNSDAVTFQLKLPDGIDEAAAITLKIRGEMGGATDTPTVAVESFFNEGDTKVADASAAFTNAVGTFSTTIAAADIPSGAKTLSVELTPGAHTTDTLIIYAISLDVTLINSGQGAGLLGADSTPALNTANGDTDGSFELTWAASDTTAVGFQLPLPPDLDDTADVVIHLRAKMSGATDTPVISADSYFNEADTKVEDDSTACGSAFAEETITIGAADVPSGAQTLSVELTPGAHTTDTLKVSAIWLEYTRALLTA